MDELSTVENSSEQDLDNKCTLKTIFLHSGKQSRETSSNWFRVEKEILMNNVLNIIILSTELCQQSAYSQTQTISWSHMAEKAQHLYCLQSLAEMDHMQENVDLSLSAAVQVLHGFFVYFYTAVL